MSEGRSSLVGRFGEAWVGTRSFAVALLMLAAACQGPECVVQTTQYSTSVNSVGYIGPTQGQPVARFDLTQDFITHTPYEACAQGPLEDVGAIRATVTNISSLPLLLVFDLQGVNAAGLMVWDHVAKVERILPNETVDLGQVGVSTFHVDLGAKVVFTEVTILPE
jgi:hypothetical protein